jgi:hypothetical protein
MFMCKKHWFSLPKHMRDAIWLHYRPGQEKDKSITKAYSEAAQKAVRYVARQENASEKDVAEAILVYIVCEEEE